MAPPDLKIVLKCCWTADERGSAAGMSSLSSRAFRFARSGRVEGQMGHAAAVIKRGNPSAPAPAGARDGSGAVRSAATQAGRGFAHGGSGPQRIFFLCTFEFFNSLFTLGGGLW